jgi:hypothetical protein
MIRHVLAGSVSIVAVALVACSGDEAGASISAQAACDDAAKAYCAKVEECAPFFVKLGFGDVATCEQRIAINCVPGFSATGTSATPSRLSQCATDVKALPCDDVLGRNLPASCRTEPGTLSDGAPCGVDAQCTGRLCRQSSNGTCGACSTLGAGGATCERDEDCDTGLACAEKKCVTLAKAGSPCTLTSPCVRSLSCNEGTCAVPLAGGAACEPSTVDGQNPCDGGKGFFCHPQTKVCTSIGTAAAGGACGIVDQSFVICTNGGHCKTGTPPTSGTCLAAAADGAACDDTNGPKCIGPARCVGGVCKITDPASCK